MIYDLSPGSAPDSSPQALSTIDPRDPDDLAIDEVPARRDRPGRKPGPHDRNIDRLNRLIDRSMSLAEAAHDQALATQSVDMQAALVFERVARGVARLIAGQARLSGALPPARAAPAAAGGRTGTKREKPSPRKETVRRICEASIAENAAPRDTQKLLAALPERLSDPRTDAELAEQTVGEVAELVCVDLGIKPYFRRFTDAELEAVVEVHHAQYPELSKLPTGVIGSPERPALWFPSDAPENGHDPPEVSEKPSPPALAGGEGEAGHDVNAPSPPALAGGEGGTRCGATGG